jgi:hypothetical protein
MFPHTSGVVTGGRLAGVQLLSEGDEVAQLAKLHSGSSDQQNPGLLEDWNAVHCLVQILCSAPW